MKINIKNYNADQWGEIIKHPRLNKYLLILNNDKRNPYDHLALSEKNNNKTIDKKEWGKET